MERKSKESAWSSLNIGYFVPFVYIRTLGQCGLLVLLVLVVVAYILHALENTSVIRIYITHYILRTDVFTWRRFCRSSDLKDVRLEIT